MLIWSVETRPRLENAFPDSWTGDGIFSAMTDPVWGEEFDASELDVYFISTYGKRFCSPYLRHYVGDDVDDLNELTGEEIAKIANFVQSLYRSSWSHLWAAYVAEYNPVDNYNAQEVETLDRATGRNTETVAQSVTNTDRSGTVEQNTFGYNSSESVPSGTESTTETGESANVAEGTEEETGTEAYTRELSRHGNIGTTAAQMIEGEREVWQWLFMGNVMEDVCKVLSLSIY